MKSKLPYYLLFPNLLLSACGGGGSGGSDNSKVAPSTPIAPETKVTLEMTTTKMQIFSNEGDALPVAFEGAWNASNLGNNSVYIQVIDEGSELIRSTISAPLEPESFTLDTAINHTLQAGEYASTVSVVACKDSSCNSTYTDSKVTVDLQITIASVPEWQTHQANASHNGYVPIWLNHSEFQKLWEWERGPSSEPIGGINAPVAGNGAVYVSTDVYFGDAAVIALDELTGEERWHVPFGNMPSLNPPALNNETLFVATSGHENTKLWAIDRAEGKLKFQANFYSQWGHYLAPTVYGDIVYQTGGYYGGHTYAFSSDIGEEVWSQSQGTSWGMDTPAVDKDHVYVHNGIALSILAKDSGKLLNSITDPLANSDYDYDYHGAPVIGSDNNVLAFSGGAFSGRASSNAEHYDNRVISNFGIANNEYLWSSKFTYQTFFATSNGVVYAGKNNPVSLDAIDEATGEILWSWVAPSTEDTSFHRNVVVTKNLVFVSTNAHLYAIDLESRESVWSYDEPGMIAISNNRILFLASGVRESDGRLIAFDLRSK